jgi:hypothetical protein
LISNYHSFASKYVAGFVSNSANEEIESQKIWFSIGFELFDHSKFNTYDTIGILLSPDRFPWLEETF